jgi:peptide deformylase
MILPIRTLGDPVLKTPTAPVTRFDDGLRTLARDMVETMYDAPGVGLAGPQVGRSIRMFVFDDGESGPTVVVNPELSDGEGRLEREEGCLSIPGPYHDTPRLARVICRGQDLDGRPIEILGEDLLARILQHETDHLDGTLFIDQLDPEGRREVLSELRRLELESLSISASTSRDPGRKRRRFRGSGH